MDARHSLGRLGEAEAARLYEQMGCTVLERNFRCSIGEIDLIVREGRSLVFCEVKTRRTSRWGEPSEAVAGPKQARLRRLAAQWLNERRPGRCEIRFDVVSVIVGPLGVERIDHLPNAF
jgi:putative endonuclease